MTLRLIGKDPGSPDGGPPTVWLDDADGSIVIQGWKIEVTATLAVVEATGPMPHHETVLRLPGRMAPFLWEVCVAGVKDR